MGPSPSVLGMDHLSFPALVGALVVVVFFRAQGTYWLGRAVTASARRLRSRPLRGGDSRDPGWWERTVVRVERWSNGESGRRAAARLHRWGPIAVTLSFLTVGIQTAVNGTAGLSRMSFTRYTLAMLPGCVAWALIYASVGLAAFYAAVALAARSPWVLMAVALALLVAIAAAVTRRRRQRQSQSGRVAVEQLTQF